MSTERIIYYRGIVIIKAISASNYESDSYRIIINGIKSAIALTSLQAAHTVIDTHLKDKTR